MLFSDEHAGLSDMMEIHSRGFNNAPLGFTRIRDGTNGQVSGSIVCEVVQRKDYGNELSSTNTGVLKT